jgi:predicted transcriptional regulator of viral defense system
LAPIQKITITQALSDKLAILNQPVVTNYDIGVLLQSLYSIGKHRGKVLHIHKKYPEKNDFDTIVEELYANGILGRFEDSKSIHKIFGKRIDSEEELLCAINPFAYISHLSAMEYHGLTDNIPRVLIYSAPDPKNWKEFAHKKMEKDSNGSINESLPKLLPLNISKIGKKNIIAFNSIHAGAYINVKNTSLRVSSIGRTFLDMIRKPDLCDGIYSVLQTFEEHAETYSNLIIDEINLNGHKIDKIRVGYILDERVGIKDSRIDEWKKNVQRGGSRKLDPTNEYSSKYSEIWCLSLNIEE